MAASPPLPTVDGLADFETSVIEARDATIAAAGSIGTAVADAEAARDAAEAAAALATSRAAGLALATPITYIADSQGEVDAIPSPTNGQTLFRTDTGALYERAAGAWAFRVQLVEVTLTSRSSLGSFIGGAGARMSVYEAGQGSTWDWQTTNPYGAEALTYVVVAASGSGFWVRRLWEGKVVTPQMFGALGNGASDDLPAFNAMTTFALVRGFDIHLPAPPAVYRVTDTWHVGQPYVFPEAFAGLDEGGDGDKTAAFAAFDAVHGAGASAAAQAANALVPRPRITSAPEGATIWGDFTSSTDHIAIVSYNLNSGNGGKPGWNSGLVSGLLIQGREAFTAGVYNGELNVIDSLNHQVGFFAIECHGLSVEKISVHACREGVLIMSAFWGEFKRLKAWGAGCGVRLLQMNASHVENVEAWYCGRGVHVYSDNGSFSDFSTQECDVGVVLTGFNYALQGGYIENVTNEDDYQLWVGVGTFPTGSAAGHIAVRDVRFSISGGFTTRRAILTRCDGGVLDNVRTQSALVEFNGGTHRVFEGDIIDNGTIIDNGNPFRVINIGGHAFEPIGGTDGARLSSAGDQPIRSMVRAQIPAPGGTLAAGAATHYSLAVGDGAGELMVFVTPTSPYSDDVVIGPAHSMASEIRVPIMNLGASGVTLDKPLMVLIFKVEP